MYVYLQQKKPLLSSFFFKKNLSSLSRNSCSSSFSFHSPTLYPPLIADKSNPSPLLTLLTHTSLSLTRPLNRTLSPHDLCLYLCTTASYQHYYRWWLPLVVVVLPVVITALVTTRFGISHFPIIFSFRSFSLTLLL